MNDQLKQYWEELTSKKALKEIKRFDIDKREPFVHREEFERLQSEHNEVHGTILNSLDYDL